mmetsp:Transcript_27988/g.39806  ORF Transcript_27988/g.39806 Transcript_27988/m.39806 type:complete len:227 (-) Transcript_27988:2371-3051(-)
MRILIVSFLIILTANGLQNNITKCLQIQLLAALSRSIPGMIIRMTQVKTKIYKIVTVIALTWSLNYDGLLPLDLLYMPLLLCSLVGEGIKKCSYFFQVTTNILNSSIPMVSSRGDGQYLLRTLLSKVVLYFMTLTVMEILILALLTKMRICIGFELEISESISRTTTFKYQNSRSNEIGLSILIPTSLTQMLPSPCLTAKESDMLMLKILMQKWNLTQRNPLNLMN